MRCCNRNTQKFRSTLLCENLRRSHQVFQKENQRSTQRQLPSRRHSLSSSVCVKLIVTGDETRETTRTSIMGLNIFQKMISRRININVCGTNPGVWHRKEKRNDAVKVRFITAIVMHITQKWKITLVTSLQAPPPLTPPIIVITIEVVVSENLSFHAGGRGLMPRKFSHLFNLHYIGARIIRIALSIATYH